MDLSILTDTELALSLGKLTGDEREVALKVLYHLIELERRGCFRDEGYSSLFDYCTCSSITFSRFPVVARAS